LYPDYKRDYDIYERTANENVGIMFGKTLKELKLSDNLTEEETRFMQNYYKKVPLDTSPSVMNKICWAIEDVFDNMSFIPKDTFDYSVLKSNQTYDNTTFKQILSIYKDYKKDSAIINKKMAKKSTNDDDGGIIDKDFLTDLFKENCCKVCPNEFMLCDILVDLGYTNKISKNLVWYICGDTIIQNLLSRNNNLISYPMRDTSGDLQCCGSSFSMKTIEVRW
jgi:hypothetical protein